MDMDNSVVLAGGRGVNGNKKKHKKDKNKNAMSESHSYRNPFTQKQV